MKSYVLNLATGGETIEILADSETAAIHEACEILERHGYPDAIEADQWDADGLNGDDRQCWRLLFWESEQNATDDPGIKSIAELSMVE